jgi:hypothetical protein
MIRPVIVVPSALGWCFFFLLVLVVHFVISTLFLFLQISGPPGVGTMQDANLALFMSARIRSNIHFSSGKM